MMALDSKGNFSDKIDVVIFDRQYSSTLFEFEGATVVPAEAVYAVFEAKQMLEGAFLAYAQAKVASVRRLTRTSLTIPTINGNFRKAPPAISAGAFAAAGAERSGRAGCRSSLPGRHR
jgi:hypothetical protein